MKKFINKINSKATELAIRTKTALASKSGEGYKKQLTVTLDA